MGKRKKDQEQVDKARAVRWEMSMTLPGPRSRKIERHGDGIVIIDYVPLEEWPAERRYAWERLWQDLLRPRPDTERAESESRDEQQA